MVQNPYSRIELVDEREYQKEQMKPTIWLIDRIHIFLIHQLRFSLAKHVIFLTILVKRRRNSDKIWQPKNSSPLIYQESYAFIFGKRKDCSESCYWLVLIFGAAGRLIKGASQPGQGGLMLSYFQMEARGCHSLLLLHWWWLQRPF